MTNADRIRTMSDEKLAEFMLKIDRCIGLEVGCTEKECIECAGMYITPGGIKKWLRAES